MENQNSHLNEWQAIKDVENALRDFISIILHKKHGDNWIQDSGITPDGIKKLEEKRETERNKLGSANIETRLIYYSEIWDLARIIRAKWDSDFKDVFGDIKRIECYLDVYMNILSTFRIASAHNRDLLSFQKHLVIGISGEIRNRLVTYRSKMETADDVFPRIESIVDNYNNIWTPGQGSLLCETELRKGDYLEFTIKATDPLGGKIFYALHPPRDWKESNLIGFEIGDEHIGKPRYFTIAILSDREYHADQIVDQAVMIGYVILPKMMIP
jgi:hypothetical protein